MNQNKTEKIIVDVTVLNDVENNMMNNTQHAAENKITPMAAYALPTSFMLGTLPDNTITTIYPAVPTIR